MRYLFIISGFLSLGLGTLGILLPILPTTPFLLLTGFLFSKGSTKYQTWFKSTKLYSKYLSNFMENKSMTKKQKWTLLLLVDTMLLISFITIDIFALKIFIVSILIIKHWYFYKFIKIAKEN